MSVNLTRLAPLQLDALRELASIGAGHAATALAQMTGRRVGISVPAVSVTPRTAVSDAVGAADEPTIVLRVTASGSFSAGFVLVFTERDALRLTSLLLNGRAEPPLGSLARSALIQAGHALAAAYVTALADLTGWTIPLSAPELLRLRAGGADIALSGIGDYVVCVETAMTVGDIGQMVRGHVLLFPRRGTIAELLSALGLPAV